MITNLINKNGCHVCNSKLASRREEVNVCYKCNDCGIGVDLLKSDLVPIPAWKETSIRKIFYNMIFLDKLLLILILLFIKCSIISYVLGKSLINISAIGMAFTAIIQLVRVQVNTQ